MVAMEIVDRHLEDPDDRRLIEGALDSLKRGASMIRQVLAFARGVEGERVNVDVEGMLRDVVTLARMTVPKGIEVRFDVREVVLPVLGDVTQLSQVFLNLVTNARDAIGDQGYIQVHAHNAYRQWLAGARVLDGEAVLRDVVVVEVSDDGQGMDEATVSKIFEPFFTTKAFGVGSGLGLSTSLAIVRSHGGEITVTSTPGEGTIFRVVLPASRSVSPAEELDDAPTDEPRDESVTSSRLLIVDDEEAITSLLRAVLTGRGFEVDCLADGAQALTALGTEVYDVALVDLNMPELGGQDLVRQIRERGSTMPVIFMSGYGEGGAETASLAPGTFFLAKPFGVEELISLLDIAQRG